MRGREVLEKGTRFVVGDGQNISIWDDRWIPRPHSFKPFSLPMLGTENMRVCDLIDPESNEWMMPMLRELFTVEEAELIASIPLSRRRYDDRLVWHYERRGEYKVKSGYHLLRTTVGIAGQGAASGSGGHVAGRYWSKVWNATIPPKVRTFIWRLCRNILPTRYELRKKVNLPSLECVFCHDHVETAIHLFKECRVVQCFWLNCPLKWRSDGVPGDSIWV